MGASIVGSGSHHYRYVSGREGDTFLTRLGRCRAGKGYLYIRCPTDVDAAALRELLFASVRRKRGGQEPT